MPKSFFELHRELAAQGITVAQELARLEAIRSAYAKRAGHVCPLYETARSYAPHFEGLSDPAIQDGIGCPLCYPPDGRVR